MSLEKKVVLITGGNDEIGRATAKAAIARGAKVVFSCEQEDEAEFVQSLVESGGEAIFHRTDISRSDLMEEMLERIVEEFGRLDIVFNNFAEMGEIGLLNQLDEQEAFNTLDTNVFGTWVAMKYQIGQMLRNNGGIIINNCSILGVNPLPAHCIGSASHHAIVAMTKSSAVEYARFNIRINAIAPGFIATSRTENIRSNTSSSNGNIGERQDPSSMFVPMGRLGKPEEVAKAVFWLCSDELSFTTGQVLNVSGGFL